MMAAAYAERLLDILIVNANRILDAQFGWDRAEPTFFQIVDLIREHPTLPAAMLSRVASVTRQPRGEAPNPQLPPNELIELLAHEFRWTELLTLAEERVQTIFRGDRKLAVTDISWKIPKAFADNWDGRQFFRRYQDPA